MTKHILSLSIALAGACTLNLTAFAQDAKPAGGPGGRPPMTAEARLAHMKEALALTDDQVTKIKPILEKAQESGKAIHEDTALQPDEKRAKFEALMKSTHEEVDAILTPEQKEKQKEEMEKRRAARGGGGAAAAK